MLKLGSSHHPFALWLHRFKSLDGKAIDVPFRSGDFSVTSEKAAPKLEIQQGDNALSCDFRQANSQSQQSLHSGRRRSFGVNSQYWLCP